MLLGQLVACKHENKVDDQYNTISLPAQLGSSQPFLFKSDNMLLLSWTQKINDSINAIEYATFNNNKWSDYSEIVKGTNWFVNWADFPAISKNKQNLLTHYLKKSDPATFAYDIYLKMSNDGGKNWNKDFKLNSDNTNTEHGFVSMLPYKNNSFFVTWLDGRNTTGGMHDESDSHDGAMTIRTAIITESGNIIDDTLVDSKTCDCCQTSAAITTNGPVIVYRDRSNKEIRDIYISRMVNKKWTSPLPIYKDNWQIEGCPVNGPKADSFKNTLAVAWFSAAKNKPEVKIIFSIDGGANFSDPIRVDGGHPIGRVDVVLIDNKNALISWLETEDDMAELRVRKIQIDGKKGNFKMIEKLSSSRTSGFPQMEILKDSVFFAWNDHSGENSKVKGAIIPLSKLK
jgi:hypothetical protein